MPNRTPGPWRYNAGFILGPSGEIVAAAFNEDDRRLMTAAPELLAACRATAASIVQQMRYHREMQATGPKHLEESLGIANAAIAKAEGHA